MQRLYLTAPNNEALSILAKCVPWAEILYFGTPSIKQRFTHDRISLNTSAPPINGWERQTLSHYNKISLTERWGIVMAPYVADDKNRTMNLWKKYAGTHVSPVWIYHPKDRTSLANFRMTARVYTESWTKDKKRPIVCLRLPQDNPDRLVNDLYLLTHADNGVLYHIIGMTTMMINALQQAPSLASGSTSEWLKATERTAIFEHDATFKLMEQNADAIPDLAHLNESGLLTHNAVNLVEYATNYYTA
jgi:hypothetical protein